MQDVKLLDCTLRDGAYLIDKQFGNTAISGIIAGLSDAHIDIVEIGFLQDEGFGEGKTVFRNNLEARAFIPKNKNGTMFSVLADYSRYSIENLDEHTEDGIDAIRECFFKKERFDAIRNFKAIKEKGYLLFVQPVDILGYSDKELIEYIELINEIEPYCFSIVDTFGSMYQEDLHRIFEIIHHNLIPSCRIGFHSHNNMQLSNALSQEFVRMTVGKRKVIVDSTISGMGRGAGNTPTELIAQYMVSCWHYHYNMDAILDVIDGYMNNIRSRCSWGYTTPYFIAGCYSAHVNNIAYLSEKNSIRSKDIRYILNKISKEERKRYHYDLLEKTYVELLHSDIDDSGSLQRLQNVLSKRNVLILLPGKTSIEYIEEVKTYIQEKNPIIISVNFIHDKIQADYLYMSNAKRFDYWKNDSRFQTVNKILTSNLADNVGGNEQAIVVSFTKLIKCGWEYLDNSAFMLLRLLDGMDVSEIGIAGFDGFEYYQQGVYNYADQYLELSSSAQNAMEINKEIRLMLMDYLSTRKNQNVPIQFVTPSRFESCLAESKNEI